MKIRAYGAMAFAMASVMLAISATSGVSASAAPTTDVAQAIITETTGSAATDVAPVAGQRRLRQQLPQATRELAVLTAGQSSATFTGLIPAGSKITPTKEDFQVLTPSGLKMTIGAPWAVDAAGKQLATSYTFTGNTITQNVDTTGATFPVVADPTVTYLLVKYVHFSRTEVFKAYYSGHLDYLTLGSYACGQMAGIINSCAKYYTAEKVNMGQGIYKAANSYTGTSTACVTFVFSIVNSVYRYYQLNRC
jgi:hypothetical protein